ncbi:MAG: phosphatidate cytidylyltransferase [Pseudomonadota bacterium]
MTAPADQWTDLKARMVPGLMLVVIGVIGIWLGGHAFHFMVALICALMVWELVGMLRPGASWEQLLLGGLAGAAVLCGSYLPIGFALPILLLPALYGFARLEDHRTDYMNFAVMITLAGFGMIAVRDTLGVSWMLWLVLVVVATDVVGYFAGRFFGGPKFWPKVSPKKTWSGTVAGWVAAGCIGALGMVVLEASAELIGISVAVSMASQMGDIAESGMKRKMGVKDSSSLIPGHGGVMDRFDGMLGASLFLLVTGPIINFPPSLAG